MQCRKGPNAVRTGHTARFASLDSRKAGAKTQTWAQGGAATEQAHGTYAKTANHRLSYCRWCWLLPRTPQMPKRRVLAFGIAPNPNTQHTNCNTLPAPHRPVLPPGSSLASCGKSPAARRNQNGPTTPPKTEVSGGNGTWDAAGGHFHGTLASSGRALLPAVRHPTKPAK
jgi:hypothetical protein